MFLPAIEFECYFFDKNTKLRPNVQCGQYCILLDQSDCRFLYVNCKVPH